MNKKQHKFEFGCQWLAISSQKTALLTGYVYWRTEHLCCICTKGLFYMEVCVILLGIIYVVLSVKSLLKGRTMNVTVKYFAVCHEMLDRSEEEMELPEGATVGTILKRLEEEWPEIAEFYEVMQMSVNWEYATENTELTEGDEVALIPPVTGGCDV